MILSLLLAINGCLVREEIITIDEKGNGAINFEIDGEIDNANPTFALPSDKNWAIEKNSIKPGKGDQYKVDFKATKAIPAGNDWPSTFADENTNKVYLDFPTATRIYKKGNRTFYEFNRRYLARKNYHAETIYNDENDQKLEAKVYDLGLFNVTAQERDSYLNNLAYKLAYRNWHLFVDVLGVLLKEGKISIADKRELQKAAQPVLEKVFDSKIILDVLSDENKIAHGLGFLDNSSDAAFEKLMSDKYESNQALIDQFKKYLADQRLAYKITGELSAQQFSIQLNMPGEIVETSGAIDPETPNKIYWIFKGEDLFDREISLYALSVVEN